MTAAGTYREPGEAARTGVLARVRDDWPGSTATSLLFAALDDRGIEQVGGHEVGAARRAGAACARS
ncbi:MAG TPA: hypothetical protein VI011_02335 [Asanoa sp.]